MVGQTISHYKILEKFGEGGMGVVYKAEDTKLHRMVAVKFLPRELTNDPDAKQRFIHEAQAASALDHPNVCTVYEIDETTDGASFIAMAFYEGQSLQQKIARSPLKVHEAIDCAIQIASGLKKAHESGIVHRDIKPANVLITADGVVKIVDFGLAKLRGRTKLTRDGASIGTIEYKSPEQSRGEDVDQRTDIWSLGCIMYEMVTVQGRLRASDCLLHPRHTTGGSDGTAFGYTDGAGANRCQMPTEEPRGEVPNRGRLDC
jgi:serine/threonine-protein kinase